MRAGCLLPETAFATKHLRLRLPSAADIDAIFEYASDPEVTALMDWKRLSDPSEVRDFLARTAEGWKGGAEFTWVITLPDEDRVIGGISLRAREEEADFGYVLNRRAWGQGIATEASKAVVEWARAVRRIPRIWATCDAENHRSMRVLEKTGLKREGLLPGGTIRPSLSSEPRDSYLYGLGPAA